jgi:outer membrane lipoprotein-sorting protein
MRRTWWLVLVVLLVAACAPGQQPSAEEIVRRAQTAMENLENVHAVVEAEVTPADGEAMRIVGEGWMQDEQTRATVLEASEDELVGTLAVSDGETGWLYHPDVNTVLTGDKDELEAYKEANQDQAQSDLPAEWDFNSLTEMVDELLRITTQELVGSETVAGLDTWHLRLTPNAEAPVELSALGGTVDLWISKEYDVPLQVTYTGGSMGEGRVTVNVYEPNPTFDAALFTFTPPAGAEVVDVATLLPERMTLAEAREAAGFTLLSTPDDTAEAALLDVYRVRDAYIQEFDGTLGEWTLTQSAGAPEHHDEAQMDEAETVTVRGTEGWLHSDAEHGGTVLAWEEAGAFRIIAGDISLEAAAQLAEALE